MNSPIHCRQNPISVVQDDPRVVPIMEAEAVLLQGKIEGDLWLVYSRIVSGLRREAEGGVLMALDGCVGWVGEGL